MSGGSMEYAYIRVEQVADDLEKKSTGDPLRLAFAKHLKLVARAMHDIEWVDSNDYGPGDEVGAIEAVLKLDPMRARTLMICPVHGTGHLPGSECHLCQHDDAIERLEGFEDAIERRRIHDED